jgi:hypothetical protein
MGRGKAYTGFWWGNLGERDHLEGSIILMRIFRNWGKGYELD